ncbi:uncharacterized protein CC84DRAFT_1220197 [Paraphaeosphaeria sporulosa]|uniref:ABC transporter domain-containing protein n=1 Tax=Paraphaeosphaeria sporulosa TaxID=1460663 RepID=A0A177C995_9PLEO|nr:uncharacterized protein CC84DRAFT_1220197 [Paraphaeosphaeria sporulosa]OAG03327.1 hypothetical protein CC84DRAFT_1220197 [Paraphaeosphaeria sporulosa]
MAPALLTSPVTSGQVLVNKSLPALSITVEPVSSDTSSTDNSVESSPTSKTMSKPPGSAINENDAVSLMSTKILEIVFDYALNKFDDSRERLEVGRPRFIEVLNEFVKNGSRIDMALPAFPFKSANKVYKALGFLPDKAEELSLSRLHNMCRRIEEIYTPGANVVIISDGLVYNDLLSISDRHTWIYGQALRAMAVEKGFTNIRFSRLRDFVPADSTLKLPDKMDEISYVANATNFRRFILNKFGKDGLDVDQLIATDTDTRLTYQGYRRFLMSDLRYIFTLGADRNSTAYKRETKYLAKQMIVRGVAFAGAIKHNFPNYLRLSIHQSTGEHKVSMSLLNTKTGYTTPWHCSVALQTDGEWTSAPKGDFEEMPRMKVVEENGRPSYFREMTEEEFLEDQRRAEEAAKLAAKPVVDEIQEPERNEDFVQWEGLTYEAKNGGKTKRLLDQVDGWLRGGTLTALMGVSGAGKSVLLDVLANRSNSGIVHGDILVNGQTSNSKSVSATVYQQDLQLSAATVKEALIFSALLRQPKTTPVVEKIAYAEGVLNLIGLDALADTVIGVSALNSEQRKRLSIGIELAAKPTNLLLLDQPLAGLDSQAALSICQLLRKVAQKGLAILCVVNQPSARLLQTFDRLLLLGEGGKQLYFGKIGQSCKTMISYFEKNGARPCKANENPAEWTLDVTSSTEHSDETQDWSEVWNKSQECKATKSKLAQLKKKFSATAEQVDGPVTSDAADPSAPGFDALALQRAFYKYIQLEKMQLPSVYPTDASASSFTNGATVPPPAYLS